MTRRSAWLLLALLTQIPGSVGAAAPETAAEIQACVDANMPEASSVQSIALRAKDRVGSVSESKATIYWKKFEDARSRVLIEFSLPDDLRGAGVLMLDRKQPGERDIFMYLPELRSVKRVTSRMMSGSMFGTDFSFEDFEMIVDYAGKKQVQRVADATVDGETAWVLESRPEADQMSGYTRILEYVDPKTCVRIQVDLFGANDRLRKVASVDRKALKQTKGLWYAPTLTLRDTLAETETDLVIERIEVGADIPNKFFSQANLTKGR
jgi:hypothetical protein